MNSQERTFFDADSHIMELPDFLIAHADPKDREQLPAITASSGGRVGEYIQAVAGTQGHSAQRVAEMRALGQGLIAGPKGYMALGAFNREERTQALDQLGFQAQLVFSTFSAAVAFDEARSIPNRYAAARAHNRAMAHFCANDQRLMGVAALPLDDNDLAIAEVEHLIKLGLKAAWIPHRPCGGRSPGHNDLDRIWAHLAEAGIPFVLHVGGFPLQIEKAWMNTGRPVPTDWLGGGENVRGKDMTSLHHAAERFIGTLVLDGVLERHPNLKGGAIELGAGWVPSMLKRLDWTAEIWAKSEADLKALTRKPSEQISAQMGFTPFPYEDVGELIRQSNEQLYLFSSDYPHTEGGRNPLGRFSQALSETPLPAQEAFYAQNFKELFAPPV